MLTIRRIQPSDFKKIADLIKKSPIGYREYKTTDNKLKWTVSVYNANLQNKRFAPSKYLEQQIQSSANKRNFLVVEDNNKIIGVIKKSQGVPFANLYLDDKYYRQGMQNALINKVEQSFVKQIGNQIVTKSPYTPVPILKQPNSKTFISQPQKITPPTAPLKMVPKSFNK
jgi:hypothetical protein